jgi:hypothetical protein
MAVVWETLGIGSTARITALCEVCHNAMETHIAKPVETVIQLCQFKHCGRIDTPPPQIQEDLLYLSKEKDIKERRVVWIGD